MYAVEKDRVSMLSPIPQDVALVSCRWGRQVQMLSGYPPDRWMGGEDLKEKAERSPGLEERVRRAFLEDLIEFELSSMSSE